MSASDRAGTEPGSPAPSGRPPAATSTIEPPETPETLAQTPAEAPIERRLERERTEVEVAISMVRSGAATVVNLAGLDNGSALLESLAATAAGAGVSLEAAPGDEIETTDLIVVESGRPDSHQLTARQSAPAASSVASAPAGSAGSAGSSATR